MFKEKAIKDFLFHKECQVIAFDCFDTILMRKVSPRYVIKLWAKELVNYFDLNCDIEELYDLLLLSNTDKTNMSYLMAKKLKNYFHITKSKEFIEQKLIQIMINTECRVTYTDNNIVKLLNFANKLNKKIILISDYYLSKEHLIRILKFHCIDVFFQHIYVSCDYMANKASGELYKKVLLDLNIKPNNLIMIGDNIYSDYKLSTMQGIKSFYINRKKQFLYYDYYDKNNASIKIIINNSILSSYSIKDNTWKNLAFSLYAFIDRLYSLLLKKNIKHIYFLAREGKFLKHLFDLYREKQRYQNEQYIETSYLYVSRRSVFIACFKNLKNEDFHLYFRRYKNNNINDFLSLLNFNSIEIESIKDELQGIDFKKKVYDLSNSTEFCALIKSVLFQEIYEKKRKEQRKNILNYFDRMKLDNIICLVDIGWAGVIQDCIYELYHKKRHTIGFYYGFECSDDYIKTKDIKNEKHGIMFTVYEGTNKMDLLSKVYSANNDLITVRNLYETFTTCEDGSAIDYTKDDIIFDNIPEERELYINIIKPIQDKILELYIQILNDFKIKAISFEDYKYNFMKIQMNLWMEMKRKKITLENFVSKYYNMN